MVAQRRQTRDAVNEAVERVDITPHPSLLQRAGRLNYSIPEAVGELVDNEVDARRAGELLSVEVYIGTKGGGQIQVKGDGSGMSPETLASAMRMGFSTKGGDLIGLYGLGMKTASSYLGGHVEIVTAQAGDDLGSRIVYDQEEFLAREEWSLPLERIKTGFDHGTMITITKLNVNIYGGVNEAVAVWAGRVFRHFITNEQVALQVNGIPIVPFEWDLEDGPSHFEFDVNGKTVLGWYGLQRIFTPKTGYGFDLIRHNRIVKRHEKIGFNAHPKLNKIVGEIHLDEFSVTNNKNDFIRGTDDWNDFEEWMKETVRPLVDLANRRYPSKLAPQNQALVEGITEKIEQAVQSEEFARSLDQRLLSDALSEELKPAEIETRHPRDGKPTGETNGKTEEAEAPRPRTPSETREVLRRTRTKLLNIRIEHVPVKFGADSMYKTWEEDGLGDRHRLVVSSNLDHPMFSALDDAVVWIKHNIAEAVAEFLSRETGLAQDMLKIKSDVLRHVGEIEMAEEREEQLVPTL
jgi:hypothetical protein